MNATTALSQETKSRTTGWFLWPLIVSVAVLVGVKGIFAAIFPDMPADDAGFMELYHKYIRPNGPDLFEDIYDTLMGLAMFVVFLAVFWCKWSDWCRSTYSRMMIVHLMLMTQIYAGVVRWPRLDTMFHEQVEDDWMVLVKRPSLLIGWVAVFCVELWGDAPNKWPAHFGALVLTLNVLEAVLLCFCNQEYVVASVIAAIAWFSPMVYVDRDRQLVTCSLDYKKNRPFFMIPWNPFSDRWYYRLYCLALGHMYFFSKYCGRYGTISTLTNVLPLLVIEMKSFRFPFAKGSTNRFDSYTESFLLFRVAPLWVNAIFGLCIRTTWYSYIDSNSAGRFSFWIEDVVLRNVISGIIMILSILWLRWRDQKEAEEQTDEATQTKLKTN